MNESTVKENVKVETIICIVCTAVCIGAVIAVSVLRPDNGLISTRLGNIEDQTNRWDKLTLRQMEVVNAVNFILSKMRPAPTNQTESSNNVRTD